MLCINIRNIQRIYLKKKDNTHCEMFSFRYSGRALSLTVANRCIFS